MAILMTIDSVTMMGEKNLAGKMRDTRQVKGILEHM